MYQIIRILEIDTVSIVEIQINLSLLFNSKVAHDNLFRSENDVDIVSNNSNGIIGRRNQGGALLLVRNDVARFSSLIGKE